MATIAAERPQFFEGQYLGADDLAAIVEYLRTTNARQNLGQHSWGIAIGLDLVSQPVSDTTVDYYLQPGVAVDGYGRLIVVSNPVRIEAAQFVSIGSGNVDVWIRYDQDEFAATRPGFGACGANDDYARISEGFRIVVGSRNSILERQSGVTVNEALLVDAREALLSVDPEAPLLCDAAVPHQQFPVDDEDALWLVPLGHVRWSAALNGFLPLVDPAEAEALASGAGTSTPDQVYEALMAGRAKRRMLGVVAESVFAADGLIRLRERGAEPDPVNGNDAVCRARQVRSSDLHFCEGRLKPRELVWLEGHVRVQGDTRLFDGRLEFRDKDGRDYIERTVDGNLVSAITPALLQRQDGNSKGGTDLQLLLGRSGDGRNRFSIGNVEFTGTDLCAPGAVTTAGVVVQDNGRLGIGTLNPDTMLSAPYTVRGLRQNVTENAGTADESSFDLYRLENYEAEDGGNQWQLELRDTEDTERKSLNFGESGLASSRLFLQTGGNVGIGSTEPSALLHLRGNDPALFIDINSASGQHRSAIRFGVDGGTEAGLYWSKSSDKVFLHHGGSNSIVVDHARVGLGTTAPLTTLHIAAGNDVTLGNSSGYLLLGAADGLNIVMDNNEIQARNAGAAAQLHLQVEGGEFSVHLNDASEFRVRSNGDVGIGTGSPNAKLDVRGDVRLGAGGSLFAMAGVENLRTVAGRVSGAGAVLQGAGYTALRIGVGIYQILFVPAFAAAPVVVASSFGDEDNIVSVQSASAGNCEIRIQDIRARSEDPLQDSVTQPEDDTFTFIAIGVR